MTLPVPDYISGDTYGHAAVNEVITELDGASSANQRPKFYVYCTNTLNIPAEQGGGHNAIMESDVVVASGLNNYNPNYVEYDTDSGWQSGFYYQSQTDGLYLVEAQIAWDLSTFNLPAYYGMILRLPDGTHKNSPWHYLGNDDLVTAAQGTAPSETVAPGCSLTAFTHLAVDDQCWAVAWCYTSTSTTQHATLLSDSDGPSGNPYCWIKGTFISQPAS